MSFLGFGEVFLAAQLAFLTSPNPRKFTTALESAVEYLESITSK
jgi:hypothetical protein